MTSAYKIGDEVEFETLTGQLAEGTVTSLDEEWVEVYEPKAEPTTSSAFSPAPPSPR
jgi:hypothetical protein